MPKASIVIPVFNTKPEYIQEAINSALNQTLKDIEIIIVNDGSTNQETLNYLKELEKNNRLKIIHQENKGLGGARNTGINNATGEYIGFVDSDDWIDIDFYETLYNCCVNNKADIACGILTVATKDAFLPSEKFDNKIVADFCEKMSYITNGSVCNKLFNMKLFNDLRFEEHKLYEDNPVLVELLLKSGNVAFLDKVKYYYRENPISICHDPAKSEKRKKDKLYILDRINKILENEDQKKKHATLKIFITILIDLEAYENEKEYQLKVNQIIKKEYRKYIYGIANYSFLERLFSIKNSPNRKEKVISILGIKLFFKKNQKIKKYDIIYSLGADCGCAGNLKKFELRSTSGPFDWLFKASLEKRFELLMNDFENFLNKEDLEFFDKDPNAKLKDNKHDYYYNKRTDFQFLHDFPANTSLDESFEIVKEKYLKRIKRFLNNIKNKKRVLLVWFTLKEKLDKSNIQNMCNKYCKKLNKNIDFLFIEHDENTQNAQNILIQNIGNITFITGNFFDPNDLVNGNIIPMKKIFKQYSLNIPKYYIRNIYSKKRSFDGTHRIITILGIEFKFKRKIKK